MMNTGTVRYNDSTRWEAVNERFACDHEGRMRLTIFTDAATRTHFRRQCGRCGHELPVKKTDVPAAEAQSAVTYDPSIKAAWDKQRNDYAHELFQFERDAARAQSLDEFRSEEADFLESAEWARMRGLVMKRAGGVCEGCLIRPAVQVHHTNYARRFGREMLFDLRAVCRVCHEAIHDPEDRRIPS